MKYSYFLLLLLTTCNTQAQESEDINLPSLSKKIITSYLKECSRKKKKNPCTTLNKDGMCDYIRFNSVTMNSSTEKSTIIISMSINGKYEELSNPEVALDEEKKLLKYKVFNAIRNASTISNNMAILDGHTKCSFVRGGPFEDVIVTCETFISKREFKKLLQELITEKAKKTQKKSEPYQDEDDKLIYD